MKFLPLSLLIFKAGLIIITLASVLVIGLISTKVYKTQTLGSVEKDYSIVCIGGHEYWRATFTTKGFIGIKLNDDGTPVNCEVAQ